MLKKILIFALVIAAVAAIAMGVMYRLHFSDPSRTAYCRILTCPRIDGFDDMCAVFAQAEFQGLNDPAEALVWIRNEVSTAPRATAAASFLDEIMKRPPVQRYPALTAAVRKAGAPDWTCPAAERTLPELR